MRGRTCLVFAVALTTVGFAAGAELIWPTPNRAFIEGKPYPEFVQPTESGLVESGMFGCGRTSGAQFHEGLDLFPISRDRRREPSDPVFAMLPGIVRYANSNAGLSNYGRYVVIEHPDVRPAVVTLYAHLLSVAPSIRAGARVEAGQTIGIMGHSAAGYTIPRERAHVHVEMGVRLSDRFQEWYNAGDFPTHNEHGAFNGMNIVGFDLLDFLERRRDGQVRDVQDYLARLPTAATVQVRASTTPDFVQRYPEFVRGVVPPGAVAAWRIEFTWFGLPKAWTALDSAAADAIAGAEPQIVFHDQALLERFPCQSVIRVRGGHVQPGTRMRDVLAICFPGR